MLTLFRVFSFPLLTCVETGIYRKLPFRTNNFFMIRKINYPQPHLRYTKGFTSIPVGWGI